MRWLVCGDGFLGSEFFDRTNSIKIPSNIQRSLKYSHLSTKSEIRELIKWMEMVKPLTFVNAAGPSTVSASISQKDYYESEPKKLVKSHVQILSQLNSPPTYVYISSAAVYGETLLSGANEMSQINPISPYGIGKIVAEDHLVNSSHLGIPIVILRVFSAYSNNLTTRLPFVIKQRFQSGQHAEFSGTGQELRDFVHAADVVSATSFILKESPLVGASIWNIASGSAITVSAIVNIAMREFQRRTLNANYSFYFNGEVRATDPRVLVADISKLIDLGFKPQVRPKDGLIDYFRSK